MIKIAIHLYPIICYASFDTNKSPFYNRRTSIMNRYLLKNITMSVCCIPYMCHTNNATDKNTHVTYYKHNVYVFI